MGLKRYIEGLGAYQSLFLLAVPTATVEPLKLVAVAGKGHWIVGTTMIVICYMLSLVLVERLFVIVKPKLLTSRGSRRSGTKSLPCVHGLSHHSDDCVKGRVDLEGDRGQTDSTCPRRDL